MSNTVIVSSAQGEVRIEARSEDNGVCFKTFILNDHQPSLVWSGQPSSKLSIQGVASYFAHKKHEIKAIICAKPSLKDRAEIIFQQLIADMQ